MRLQIRQADFRIWHSSLLYLGKGYEKWRILVSFFGLMSVKLIKSNVLCNPNNGSRGKSIIPEHQDQQDQDQQDQDLSWSACFLYCLSIEMTILSVEYDIVRWFCAPGDSKLMFCLLKHVQLFICDRSYRSRS